MNWTSSQKIYKLKKNEYTGEYIRTEFTPESAESDLSTEIYFEDFVTVTSNTYCTINNHVHENIQAKISILCRDGTLQMVTIPAGYCKTCNKYFIGLWQFEKLRKIGVLLCRITQDTLGHAGKSRYYNELSPESILKQYGYSVSSGDDLSDEQRRQILICLIESGVCTKNKITSHLSWLIQSREGRTDLHTAIEKWKHDRDFVDSYKMGSGRIVAMRSLRVSR